MKRLPHRGKPRLVCAHGGPALHVRHRHHCRRTVPPSLRQLALHLLVLWGSTNAARAQIIAAPGAGVHAPLVDSTANGRPLVHIVSPNAGGVSHNQYEAFSTGPEGAILNNATGDTSTRQGGWVPGNPHLADGRPADLIINEVTSTHASTLRGYLEVAGQQADVVVANPNGIFVNGFGLLNTGRAVLTTGRPELGTDGSLTALRTTQGVIDVAGAGLAAGDGTRLDLIARAVSINARLQAREINVVTGNNRVRLADLGVQTFGQDSEVSAVAIDVAALGGMYASRIRLIGTGGGVGVRSFGQMSASAGDLHIDSEGKLILRGQLIASDDVILRARDEVDNHGRIIGRNVAIGAGKLLNDGSDNDAGPTRGVIAARDALDIGAGQIINREGGLLKSGGDMRIGAALDAHRRAVGRAESVENNAATVDAGADLHVDSTHIRNSNSHFASEMQPDPDAPTAWTEYQIDGSPQIYRADEVRIVHEGGVKKLVVLAEEAAISPQLRSWFAAGRHNDYTRRDIHQYVLKTVVTRSTPGRILASGDMTLSGNKVINDKSAIVAGGVLSAKLDQLNNDNHNPPGRRIAYRQIHSVHHTTEKCGGGWKRCSKERHASASVDLALPSFDLDIWQVGGNMPIPNKGMPPLNPLTQQASAERPFLIEADPVYTDRRRFLSSDYLLARLATDPREVHKRLGDGYVEQQLLMEQLLRQTGQRRLAPYASDEAQFRALMESGAVHARQFSLQPGMALSATQMAQLTSDMVWLEEQEITLPDGSRQRVLSPVLYLARVHARDLGPTGALIAADDIQLTLTGSLANGGTLRGAARLTAQAGMDIDNRHGSLQGTQVALDAERDLLNRSGTIKGEELNLAARRDLRIATLVARTTTAAGTQITPDRTGVVTAGTLTARAGRDLALDGAHVASSSHTDVTAGRDLRLGSVTTQEQFNIDYDSHNHLYQHHEQVQGTVMASGTGLKLKAGRDFLAEAAHVGAGAHLDVAAGRNLRMGAMRREEHYDQEVFTASSGMLSSESRHSRDTQQDTQAIGSSFSGNTVALQAGQDVDVDASQVVSTDSTIIEADGDIALRSSQDRHRRDLRVVETRSGMFSGDGKLHIGNKVVDADHTSSSVSHLASTLGSTNGDVSLRAGGDISAEGGQLLAARDISLSGRNVDIAPTVDTIDSHTVTTTTTSGLRIGARSNISDAAQSVRQAMRRGEQVSDPRLKALYAAKAAYAAKDLQQAVRSLQNKQGKGASGRISAGIGVTVERHSSSSHAEQVNQAQARAGGELHVAARGDSSDAHGDITLKAARLAAKDITLDAARDIQLRSQAATSSSEEKSQKIDLEVGLYAGGSIGGGGAKGGLGVYGAAAYQQSRTEIGSTTHEETVLDADSRLKLRSGRDTSLSGAIAQGERIVGEIGRNLSLASEQDSDRYRQQQFGGQIEGRYAFGNDSGVSGSLNYSQTRSDYRSVQEQTALSAGSGGFDLRVGRHTQLDGAVIASRAAPEKNRLSTDTLGHRELENTASYDALSGHLQFGNGNTSGGGSGTLPGLDLNPLASLTPGLGTPTSEKKTSSTRSAIANGQIDVRSDQGNTSLATLSRDTDNAHKKLDRIFDAEKVAEQQELGRVLGEVGNRAIGDLAKELGLKNGSAEKMALHAALGALQAGLSGGNAVGAALAGAGTEWIGTQLASYLEGQTSLSDAQKKAIQQWGALMTGATIGGTFGGATRAALNGAAVALDAERFNRQLHEDFKAREKTLARELAAMSNGHYSFADIANALRSANNHQLGESATTGAVVPLDKAAPNGGVYDGTGMRLGTTPDGKPAFVQDPAMLQTPPADLQAYIREKTGNTYTWSEQPISTTASPLRPLPPVMPGLVTPESIAIKRNQGADAANWVSVQSGKYSATADMYAAYLASRPNAAASAGAAIQFGMARAADVIGLAAFLAEQILRPDAGQAVVEGLTDIATAKLTDIKPLLSPALNELGETLKDSGPASSLRNAINKAVNK